MLQQPAFDAQQIPVLRGGMGKSAQPALRDDAVTRHYGGEGIGGASLPHGASGAVQLQRSIAISARVPWRNLLQQRPDPALKHRARRRQREIEAIRRISGIGAQLRGYSAA